MKAIILAGGKGKRLGNLTYSIPKPMIKIGNIPVLEHQIDLVRRHGFRQIIVCTGYLSNKIEDYFGNGKKWGVSITHSRENRPLGSAGCIAEIEGITGDVFLVLYGDVMINMNIDYLIDFHNKKKASATLVVHPNDHPYDSDLVEVDDKMQIVDFLPKPHPGDLIYRNLVNAGVYILDKKVFRYIEKNKECDFGKDIFPLMLKQDELIYAYNTPEYLKDMGTSERLCQVKKDFKDSKFKSFNLSFSRPAIFLDRDGVINEEKGLIDTKEKIKLIDNCHTAIKRINNTKYLAVVVTNQPVVAKGLASIQEVYEIHKKIETLLGNLGAKIDRIYFCPHHPDRGFEGENLKYKIDCPCRKPKTGMIEKAKEDLNIDISSSYLVGDMTADILTARNANITSIGVRGGYGCRDGKYDVCPDIWADDLYNAFEIITAIETYEKYNQIIINKLSHKDSRSIISIGGIARSGKTTFAFFLKKYLQKKGYIPLVINMDDWIIPASKRKKDQDVIDRFRLQKFEKDLMSLLEGKTIKINKYDAFTREGKNKKSKKTYKLGASNIIIITGCCALNSGKVADLSDVSIFMEIEKNTYKKRFYNFYRWKKLNEENIDKLYNQRLVDELPLILESKNKADLLLRGEAH